MPDLSVIIPARNEEWLNRTVADVLSHVEADTEILVILDGAWPKEPLPQHERVTMVYLPDAIGQRAATNLGARISTASYIMKLDAHCAVDQGFDRKLLEAAQALGPDVTQVPTQYNLHIFDWVCDGCGKRTYQGPTPTGCVSCNQETTHRREIVWNAIRRRTASWRFDADLHFQYFGEFTKRPEAQAEIYDVMSCLGACWFMNRERYWQLGGLDEQHGSWGQMGTEIACKSWLSGGRLVCNTRTWFSHLFRTQGGDFSFPYPITGAEQEQARQYSRRVWKSDSWPLAVRPLSWLVDKFWPVPGWTEEQREQLRGTSAAIRSARRAGIVYYSDCRIDPEIREASQVSIERAGIPIAAVTLQPIAWDAAIKAVMPLERGYLTMFRQILLGLEMLDTEYVFFAEHDVIYDESHWSFVPPRDDCYYYNLHWIKVDASSGRAVSYIAKQTSQLCANRHLLIQHYRRRIAITERDGFSRKHGFEPGSHNRPERIDDVASDVWRSAGPNYDVRHSQNLTPSRWSRDQFRSQRNCQGWQESHINIGAILGTTQQAVA